MIEELLTAIPSTAEILPNLRVKCFPVLMDKAALDSAGIDASDNAALEEYLGFNDDRFGIGGYLEHRNIYQKSELFDNSNPRNIHLGVDLWAPTGTPVQAPLDGIVFSFYDNVGFGNYGPTIILQHTENQTKFFTLYGHLARTSPLPLLKGDRVTAGTHIGYVGNETENGNWPPHVHFQIVTDLEGNQHDFPGVCRRQDLEKYKKLSPNPELILRCNP